MTKYLNLMFMLLLCGCLNGKNNAELKQRKQVAIVYSKFRDALIDQDYKEAYIYTDKDYRNGFTKDNIQGHFANPNLTNLTTVENKINIDTVITIKGNTAKIFLGLKDSFGHVILLVKGDGGEWRIKRDIGSWSDEV